jgi:hypothetical protein
MNICQGVSGYFFIFFTVHFLCPKAGGGMCSKIAARLDGSRVAKIKGRFNICPQKGKVY